MTTGEDLAILFDRDWATALVGQAWEQACADFRTMGGAQCFDALKPFVIGGGASSGMPGAAARLGVSVEALQGQVVRLRRRYRKALRVEVARTVPTPDEIVPEMRYLREVLARGSIGSSGDILPGQPEQSLAATCTQCGAVLDPTEQDGCCIPCWLRTALLRDEAAQTAGNRISGSSPVPPQSPL